MKLLLITTDISIVGGIEQVINSLSNYFIDEYNYEVEVLSLFGNRENRINNTHFNFNDKVNIRFCNIDKPRRKYRIDEFTKDFKLKKYIWKELKNKEFDIVITFHHQISIPVLLNKHKIKGKIIVTEHSDYNFAIGRLDMLKRKLIYKNADKVIVLTSSSKNYYKNFLSNVDIINNPISFVSEKSSKCDKKRIISAGRLEFEKGFDRIIKIFANLDENYKEWVLDIYGDGSERESLIKLIKENKLENRVNILPFTKNLKKEFLESAIYVLPSRTEAFSLVLLEAMECGLPCIAFDLAGPNEIIKDGEDGFKIENNNLEEFKLKLELLMKDKEKRLFYGTNAKQNVKRYSIENIACKWKELFESII